MEKRWRVKEIPSQKKINQLSAHLKIEPVLATLLIQRGIENFDDAQQFFRPNLNQLHDPFLMKNMDLAVNRIKKAIENHEKVLLFGDYDVDGTSAVALMWIVLKPYLSHLDFYIPDRYIEGYGISFQGIDYAKEQKISLIIALDCGIKANDKIEYAKSLGIDFIICDHHEPGEIIPNAIVLDQKQKDCLYPYKELSGCGVGFKLLEGLFQKSKWDKTLLFENLDLLALSIGADLVPVTGENRIFCYFGLKLLNEKTRLGIQQLLFQAKKELPLTLTNVVFIIAPRINAAGRIHEGKKAVQLLISEDLNELETLAKSIEKDNIERRLLDEKITKEALAILDDDVNFKDKKSTIVFNKNWHKGVVGIVASRLIEKHYKPTIVLTESNGKISGSARSIHGLNVHDVLESCKEHLDQFGGHTFAAGLTLNFNQLDNFIEQFENIVQKTLSDVDIIPEESIDYELQFQEIFTENENIYEIPKIKRILNQLEPHGPENMKPVFLSTNVYVENARVLKDRHLKLVLSQPNTHIEIQAIAFNLADKMDMINSKQPLDILYTLETNSWKGKDSLQLNLKDIRLMF